MGAVFWSHKSIVFTLPFPAARLLRLNEVTGNSQFWTSKSPALCFETGPLRFRVLLPPKAKLTNRYGHPSALAVGRARRRADAGTTNLAFLMEPGSSRIQERAPFHAARAGQPDRHPRGDGYAVSREPTRPASRPRVLPDLRAA